MSDFFPPKEPITEPTPMPVNLAPYPEEPLLGLATTKQLLEELICRMEITADGTFEELVNAMVCGSLCRTALDKLSPTILAYRTVDH